MNSLDLLIRRIKDRMTVSNEDAVDVVKQYWDEAVDTVKGYWGDVDEAIVEETGVPPASITQLLDDHRQAHSYANTGGNSGVDSYDLGDDWILVKFTTGSRYLYTIKSTTREQLDEMKRYANDGKGLNSYIMRVQKTNYAGRNVKGEIFIKPGMEHYSRHAVKRIELLEAYRNTMVAQISNESLMDTMRKAFGFSNKGNDHGFRKSNLNNNAYAFAQVRDSLASPSWLAKQTYLKGPINGTDIIEMLPPGNPDILRLLGQGGAYLKDFANWVNTVDAYLAEVTPIMQTVFKAGPTDEALATFSENLAKLTKPVFLNTAKYGGGTVKEINALSEAEVKAGGKELFHQLKVLKEFYLRDGVNIKWKSFKGYNVPSAFHNNEKWMKLFQSSNVIPWKILLNNAEYNKAREEYFDMIIAAAVWMDRSIKGDMLIAKENYFSGRTNMNDKTLTTYRSQIEQAGIDGLDPVARQFMTVGLEAITPIESVAIETFGESELVPSTEDLLGAIKKFFTKGKDTEIYDTVGKGFLHNLVHEVKKYTDINWVKTHGQSDVKKVSIQGANLIAEYDKVVPEFIKACQANRVEHHKVAEQAFNNMEAVMNMIQRKSLDNSANVEKAITIMKATRQLKEPKVEVPKVKVESGEVNTLTPEQIVEEAKKLYELFNVLGADLTFVKRWNSTFINTHAWMDWKYVGKSNYGELYDQVKDPKFTELYQKAMEHVYNMHRVGVEFHQLQPYIMAVFQLIEKSVKDS
jgi:hypothetical protein